jgi:acyl carrier protein
MTQAPILQKVVEHVRRSLPSAYRSSPLSPDTPFDSLPIDSLSWFVLIQSLEKEFQFGLWVHIEGRDGVKTIGDLVALLTHRN